MKRAFFVLLLIAVLYSSTVYAAGLRVNLSGHKKYTYHNEGGLSIALHESISKNKGISQKCLKAWRDNFLKIEKICPNVTASFKKNRYKLYLYRLPSSRGGMEFIRSNQYLWDKRVNPYINKGIIIPRAYTYVSDGHKEDGFVYLLHEIAHYRHVVMLGENWKNGDREIRRVYLNSLRNPRYIGTYARNNHLEYFAEISIAYLLKKHSVSIFPSGSRELYVGDRAGYDLCKKMWGVNLAAYKPNKVNEIRLAAAPFPTAISQVDWGTPTLPEPKMTPLKGAYSVPTTSVRPFQDRLMSHATEVFKRPSKKEVLISKQFLEVKNMISKAESEEIVGNYAISNWLYSISLSMLKRFKNDNPHWNTLVIDQMIKRVESKIN